jgi:hypothetical protein
MENYKGLGDTIENVFKATKIDKVAKLILGDDCGCDERKELLNRLFPYKTNDVLTDDEREILINEKLK